MIQYEADWLEKTTPYATIMYMVCLIKWPVYMVTLWLILAVLVFLPFIILWLTFLFMPALQSFSLLPQSLWVIVLESNHMFLFASLVSRAPHPLKQLTIWRQHSHPPVKLRKEPSQPTIETKQQFLLELFFNTTSIDWMFYASHTKVAKLFQSPSVQAKVILPVCYCIKKYWKPVCSFRDSSWRQWLGNERVLSNHTVVFSVIVYIISGY